MCVETCVKISDKSDEKWSYSILNLSCFVTRDVYKLARRAMCREGWGTGLNYWFFFYWKTLGVLFLASMSYVISRAEGWGVVAEVHNTRDFMEGEHRKIALSPASELALPNDNSKLDCAGGKFKLLPGYLMERVKETYDISFQRGRSMQFRNRKTLTFIARIFVNLYKIVAK